jgi:hypothetical protein
MGRYAMRINTLALRKPVIAERILPSKVIPVVNVKRKWENPLLICPGLSDDLAEKLLSRRTTRSSLRRE